MKQAYVTTLCNGEGYLPGIEVLGSSIKATGSRVPMVLMVTPEIRPITRDRLAEQGWEIREIQPIDNPNPVTQQMLPRFGAAYTKLRAFELDGIDKAVFLDADTVVLQNVDDLFDRPAIAAAPDFFMPDRFSSGVMVIEPSKELFDRMLTALGGCSSYDGGDQGFLNTFFENWYGMPVAHRLPVGYNMAHFIYQFMRNHPVTWEKLHHEVKILHYLVQKPWRAKSTLSGASEVWWNQYFTVHPEKAQDWRQRLHELEDWSFDMLSHWIVG